MLGSPAEATLTIQDNDQAGAIQFVLPTYTVGEPARHHRARPDRGHADQRRRQRRHRRASTPATARATAGQDYEAVTTTLTFAAGEVTKFVDIPIFPDALIEGDETIVLTLSNPSAPATLGAQKTAVLTIRDSQAGVQFSAPTYTVCEGTLEPEAYSVDRNLSSPPGSTRTRYHVHGLDLATAQQWPTLGPDKTVDPEDMYGTVVQAALSPDGKQLATLYRDTVKPEHTGVRPPARPRERHHGVHRPARAVRGGGSRPRRHRVAEDRWSRSAIEPMIPPIR